MFFTKRPRAFLVSGLCLFLFSSSLLAIDKPELPPLPPLKLTPLSMHWPSCSSPDYLVEDPPVHEPENKLAELPVWKTFAEITNKSGGYLRDQIVAAIQKLSEAELEAAAKCIFFETLKGIYKSYDFEKREEEKRNYKPEVPDGMTLREYLIEYLNDFDMSDTLPRKKGRWSMNHGIGTTAYGCLNEIFSNRENELRVVVPSVGYNIVAREKYGICAEGFADTAAYQFKGYAAEMGANVDSGLASVFGNKVGITIESAEAYGRGFTLPSSHKENGKTDVMHSAYFDPTGLALLGSLARASGEAIPKAIFNGKEVPMERDHNGALLTGMLSVLRAFTRFELAQALVIYDETNKKYIEQAYEAVKAEWAALFKKYEESNHRDERTELAKKIEKLKKKTDNNKAFLKGVGPGLVQNHGALMMLFKDLDSIESEIQLLFNKWIEAYANWQKATVGPLKDAAGAESTSAEKACKDKKEEKKEVEGKITEKLSKYEKQLAEYKKHMKNVEEGQRVYVETLPIFERIMGNYFADITKVVLKSFAEGTNTMTGVRYMEESTAVMVIDPSDYFSTEFYQQKLDPIPLNTVSTSRLVGVNLQGDRFKLNLANGGESLLLLSILLNADGIKLWK